MYIDKCSSHYLTAVQEALSYINTEIRFFPANATHLVQHADSFIIQKLRRIGAICGIRRDFTSLTMLCG